MVKLARRCTTGNFALSLSSGKIGRRTLERFVWQSIDSKRQGTGTDMFSHFCHEKNEQGDYFSHQDWQQQLRDHALSTASCELNYQQLPFPKPKDDLPLILSHI